MNGRWANREEAGSDDGFETLHSGLAVQLIATPREDLLTCVPSDQISDVMDRNTELYDFVPVVADDRSDKASVIGLFHAAKYFHNSPPRDPVNDHFDPISERFLIGADASILDFIKAADDRPCRLVVSGSGMVGLVSLSDLQRLPVRATLFALITGFEIAMSEAIRWKFPHDEDWMRCLSDGRRENIKTEIEKSRRGDGFVDMLLFTQFCDKADILLKSFDFGLSKTALRAKLNGFQELRNMLAHANEYAASPEQARSICVLVRNLLNLRQKLAASITGARQ